VFDLITLPIRVITAIPYVIHYKCFRKEIEHKIIEIIRNNPEASHALSEGKVFVRKVTEDFSHIQAGTMNDKPCYNVKGIVLSGEGSDIYIKRTLSGSGDIKRSGGFSHGWDCVVDANAMSRYHAFNAK
jgi:hypothetical protein